MERNSQSTTFSQHEKPRFNIQELKSRFNTGTQRTLQRKLTMPSNGQSTRATPKPPRTQKPKLDARAKRHLCGLAQNLSAKQNQLSTERQQLCEMA
jgi:hypothetical protein